MIIEYPYCSERELQGSSFGTVGKGVKISKATTIYNKERVFIGNNVRIDNFCVLAVSDHARLVIGNNVHISAFCFLNGAEDIYIEDFVTMAPYVRIFSSTDDYSGKFMTGATLPKEYLGTVNRKVVLRKHTIIATGCTIMPGVEIGMGTAVGAHSFVNKSSRPFTIIAGIPARFIKKRSNNLLRLEQDYLTVTQKNCF